MGNQAIVYDFPKLGDEFPFVLKEFQANEGVFIDQVVTSHRLARVALSGLVPEFSFVKIYYPSRKSSAMVGVDSQVGTATYPARWSCGVFMRKIKTADLEELGKRAGETKDELTILRLCELALTCITNIIKRGVLPFDAAFRNIVQEKDEPILIDVGSVIDASLIYEPNTAKSMNVSHFTYLPGSIKDQVYRWLTGKVYPDFKGSDRRDNVEEIFRRFGFSSPEESLETAKRLVLTESPSAIIRPTPELELFFQGRGIPLLNYDNFTEV
jgi:hypothetical protein